MIMAASGNALTQDIPRAAFVADEFWQVLEPVISIEEFNAGLHVCSTLPLAVRR
jgi:hypothetical protein